MDDFERRLAASIKVAALQRPDVEPVADPSKRRAGFIVLAASVVVGSLIAGTTLLFGHGDSQDNPVDTPTNRQIILDGKWRVVALAGDDGKSLLKSYKVWLVFDARQQVGGYTECNGFGSVRYKQSGPGGRDLVIPSFAGRAQQARKRCIKTPIASRLEAVRHVRELDGVLYLQSDDGANIATLVRAFQPVTLQGAWRVTAVTNAEGKSVPTNTSTPRARIVFNDGRLSGNDGCNDFSGRYSQFGPDRHDLALRIIDMTAVGCRTGPTPHLLAVRHITKANGAVYLKDENWSTIATLERVSSSNDPGRALDPLTLTLVLGTRDGDRVSSRIRVENNSGRLVSDPACQISNYHWGVVPVTQPDKPLFRARMTRCGNSRGFPAGFVDTFEGPTFSLTEGPSFALRSLPPGNYLAAIDFGDARSERLTAKITIDFIPADG